MFNTYDIRSSANALKTLVELSGVDISTWKKYVERENEYDSVDDLVEDLINTYGHFPTNYLDWNFVYFHVTTSANECAAIKKYGILDLKHAYLCKESDLRIFLDQHGVFIDLDNALLTYKGRTYDITYNLRKNPEEDTQEYYCWSIGRKFYYDYATCGFLSVCKNIPYGGLVHHRPEILWDIDNLLSLGLSDEWGRSHSPYEVTAQVKGSDIIVDEYDDCSDKYKVLIYLTRAYETAFDEPYECVLLTKDGVQISPDNILEVNPLSCWK